jgi:F-type H+-transporting ATPase subunit delta
LRNRVLARRYAKALFELALERKMLDTVRKDIMSFSELLEKNPSLKHVFFGQDVDQKQKALAIEKTIQDKVSNVFFNFLLVLFKKSRSGIFPQIVTEFQMFVDRHHRKINAITTTAVPVDDKLRKELKTLLDKVFDADVQLTNEVDPAVLGGIVVSVDGQIIDASLSNQLLRLKKQFARGGNGRQAAY